MIRRRLFTAASAISLLLCVATVVLWVRSRFATDFREVTYGFGTQDQPREVTIQLQSETTGISLFACFEATSDPDENFRLDPSGWESTGGAGLPPANHFSPFPLKSFLGLKFYGEFYNHPLTQRLILETVVPHWVAALACGSLPLACLVLRTRARRGVCLSCSYDLTGNTSGVCPECGTPVPKEAADGNPRTA